MISQLSCKHLIPSLCLMFNWNFYGPNFTLKIGTFHSKRGSLGRLPQTGEGVDMQVGGQRLHQSDGDCTLPFSKRGGRDPSLGGDK